MEMGSKKCVLCGHHLDNGEALVVLRKKGSDGINSASFKRNDTLCVKPGQSVHIKCRSKYTNPNEILLSLNKETVPSENRELRSHEKSFSFKTDCIFCGRSAKSTGKKRGHDVFQVRTKTFQNNIENICDRRNDTWSTKVKARLEYVQDLNAADAVYHQTCSVNFRTNKHIPQSYILHDDDLPKKSKLGRHTDSRKTDAFNFVIKHLEDNDEEQITIQDLISIMEDRLAGSGCDAYGFTFMKQQLQAYFDDQIFISEIDGKPNIVTFKRTASSILNEHYNLPKIQDPEQEKMRLIETAAKLIVSDVKSMNVPQEVYPSPDELSNRDIHLAYLPKSLRVFLQQLFARKNSNLKLASIGQAIIQCTRPRLLRAPLQLGLGIDLHHRFASRSLIDQLYDLGFCCSYSEVKKYEYSAAFEQGSDISDLKPESSLQFMADNVDHNVRTLDGFNTFHGMGIIATVTPANRTPRPLPRKEVTSEDIVAKGRINMHFYQSPSSGFLSLKYHPITQVDWTDHTSNIDILWKSVWLLRPTRPNWSGMMQAVHHGHHPGQASIVYLPMIDMNPSDVSCIYSTLVFITKQAVRNNVTPIITFDQPLWWKASLIVSSEHASSDLRSIILRLGGLHTQMSFLGCIGHIMSGSGLFELLEVIYASNTVNHILTGKAIARAIRAHFLVDTALNGLLVSRTFDVGLPRLSTDSECLATSLPDTDDEDLNTAVMMYDELMSDSLTVAEVSSSNTLERIHHRLNQEKDSLGNMRTAKLWIQYMDMVDILRKFIKAERLGNWKMHLKSLTQMLPFFAAAGHNLYTKSVRLYLQMMTSLQETHPNVYDLFNSGHHVIRRSDRYWGGLSTDLVIEQVLMRNIKTNGGLTRGTGLSETQRLVWLMSMPSCTEVSNAMTDLTQSGNRNSELHKDMSNARQERDKNDTMKLLNFLKERDPFKHDPDLRNIANGVIASATVNADDACFVGGLILESMTNTTTTDFKFKRNDQIKQMNERPVGEHEEICNIDPVLLFQRFLIAGRQSTHDLQTLLKFELCSYPPALFDSPLFMKEANKPALASYISTLQDQDSLQAPAPDVVYVLDGGALLHTVPWPRGVSYADLCNMYSTYVKKHYGRATIVFDGYSNSSTKYITHMRRTGGVIGPTVKFDEKMILQSKKDSFLGNVENKDQFITMLSSILQAKGCDTIQATGDADVLIAQTAVSLAHHSSTVVIGEDTDLLVLLCYHANLDSHDIFLQSTPKKCSLKRVPFWNIRETKKTLGDNTCQNLLFLHAVLGCDTTSRIHGVGKAVALKKFKQDECFRDCGKSFNQPIEAITAEQIIQAGEKAMVCLLNGETGESLDMLRYRRFCEKVASSQMHVHPQNLPPTSAAVKYHSLRVYFQIQEWKGRNHLLSLTDWGWKRDGKKILPMQTDLAPAPKELLTVIRCNCKTNMCNSQRCSCKKHGLRCTHLCSVCRGCACLNAQSLDLSDE